MLERGRLATIRIESGHNYTSKRMRIDTASSALMAARNIAPHPGYLINILIYLVYSATGSVSGKANTAVASTRMMRTRPRAIGCRKKLRRGLQSMAQLAQIAVVGAGPAGLVSALALDALGCEVALVAPVYDAARAARDTRTTALLSSSVTLLENLEVWKLCRHVAAPLASIRIIDDRGDLLRAPEVLFRASELSLADFGANIANPALIAALNAAAQAALDCTTSPRPASCGHTNGHDGPPRSGGGRKLRGCAGCCSRRSRIAGAWRGGHREPAPGSTRSRLSPLSSSILTTTRRQHRASARGSSHHGALPGNMSSLVWVDEPLKPSA
jgi:hypothetical protein